MAAALQIFAVLALVIAADRAPHLKPTQRRLAWLAPAALLLLALIATGDVFVFEKWLPRLLMPIGLLWIALTGLACVLLKNAQPKNAQPNRAHSRGGRALALLSLFLWLTSCNAVATNWLTLLEEGYAQPSADAARFDALLVLGGGTSLAPHGPQLSPSGDRLVSAARLHHRGLTQYIVVGGKAVASLEPNGQTRSLAEQSKTILIELGVPAEAIVMDPGGRNTREETKLFAALVKSRGWKEVGLLTSAWHLPRAMLHAEIAGLAATPVPADFRGRPTAWNIVETLPSANGAYHTRLAAWEALGILLKR